MCNTQNTKIYFCNIFFHLLSYFRFLSLKNLGALILRIILRAFRLTFIFHRRSVPRYRIETNANRIVGIFCSKDVVKQILN